MELEGCLRTGWMSKKRVDAGGGGRGWRQWMLEEGLRTGWMELQESLRTHGCCRRV